MRCKEAVCFCWHVLAVLQITFSLSQPSFPSGAMLKAIQPLSLPSHIQTLVSDLPTAGADPSPPAKLSNKSPQAPACALLHACQSLSINTQFLFQELQCWNSTESQGANAPRPVLSCCSVSWHRHLDLCLLPIRCLLS